MTITELKEAFAKVFGNEADATFSHQDVSI